jgi:hypothetical protein
MYTSIVAYLRHARTVEQGLLKLGMYIVAPECISAAFFLSPSRQFVYPLSLLGNGSVKIPLSLLGNGSVKMLPLQRIHTQK